MIIHMSRKAGERLTLREMREAANLRQVDVAKRLNIDQAAVSRWENAETRPSRKYHRKLARLYNVTVDELLRANENHPVQ